MWAINRNSSTDATQHQPNNLIWSIDRVTQSPYTSCIQWHERNAQCYFNEALSKQWQLTSATWRSLWVVPVVINATRLLDKPLPFRESGKVCRKRKGCSLVRLESSSRIDNRDLNHDGWQVRQILIRSKTHLLKEEYPTLASTSSISSRSELFAVIVVRMLAGRPRGSPIGTVHIYIVAIIWLCVAPVTYIERV